MGHPGQDAVFADKVSDHDKPAAGGAEGAEQRFTHPVGQFGDTRFILAQLVIIKVVNNDVIGPTVAVAQPARRLPASACEEGDAGLGYKFAIEPMPPVVLLSEVMRVTLVKLQFGLNIREQCLCVIF